MNMITRNTHNGFPIRVVALGLVLGIALPAGNVVAQDWQFSPEITLTGEYNDNARLQTEDALENEILGAELDVLAHIERRSPTGSVLLVPRVSTSYFPDDEDEESDDYFLNFAAEHNRESSTWNFRARYSAQQIISAEIDDPDFDDPDVDRPIVDDTGLIQSRDRRSRLTVSPGVTFELSPRTSMELVGDYGDISYDNDSGAFVDYTYGNVEVHLDRQVTERNTIGIEVFGTTYESDNEAFSADAFGATARFARRLSERNSGFIYAGVQQTDTDFLINGVNMSDSTSTLVAGAGMTRAFEVSRLVLDVRHAVDPSGQGLLTERTSFRAMLSRQFSPLVTGRISARLQTAEPVLENSVGQDRDFAQLGLGLDWRLNRNWTLVSAYTFRTQDLAAQTNDATSNAVSLGIRFAPPRRN